MTTDIILISDDKETKYQSKIIFTNCGNVYFVDPCGRKETGFVWNPKMKRFEKDDRPGSNTNQEITLLSVGVVLSMGCGYSGGSIIFPINDAERTILKGYFERTTKNK